MGEWRYSSTVDLGTRGKWVSSTPLSLKWTGCRQEHNARKNPQRGPAEDSHLIWIIKLQARLLGYHRTAESSEYRLNNWDHFTLKAYTYRQPRPSRLQDHPNFPHHENPASSPGETIHRAQLTTLLHKVLRLSMRRSAGVVVLHNRDSVHGGETDETGFP
jgi:hypothetical protein